MLIDTAIKKTFKYSKKFGGQLTREQLWLRLMGPRVFLRKDFDKAIEGLNFAKSAVSDREVRKKMSIAKKMARQMILNDQDILMVAVTGSVAARNCKEGDDIDILVITRTNRLWLSRLKLLFLLIKNKHKFRRHGKKEEGDAFCFNMWLEEGSLKIPVEKQNERSAVDLILLKVLIDRVNVSSEFIRENDWAKKWVATGYSLISKVEQSKSWKIEKNNRNIIGDFVNFVFFLGQYIYMLPKRTKEVISLKMAFFHVS